MRATILILLLAAVVLAGENRPAKELLADLSNPNYQVRRKAVLAVEGRAEKALRDRAIEMAKSDPHPNIRGYAAVVIAGFGEERVFPVLAKMAKSESSPGPRHQAYVALGKLGDPRGKKILLEGLEAGRVTRGYAAKGLGLLGDPEGFLPVSRLLLAHSDDPYVAEMAPVALEKILTPDALVFLRKHFTALPAHARGSAARVLGRHPDPKTREMMIGLLSSEDRRLRLSAIGILGDLADREAAPPLIAHLPKKPEDRTAVITALGKIGDRRAATPLIDALKAEKELLPKMRLIEALGRLGDKRAIEALMPLLDDTTLLPQPGWVSSIWTFPYNARVHGAAVWAILTIRDGKEPFPIEDLSNFREGKPPARIEKDIAAIRGEAKKK